MKCLLLIMLISYGVSSIAFAAQHAPTIHVVKKDETLYGISKKYGTTEQELINLNPALKTHPLFTGEKLQLPSKSEVRANGKDHSEKEEVNPVIASKPSLSNHEKKQPVFHEVLKGETTFSLSKKYATKVDSILVWNGLKSPDIHVGQQLIVGFNSESGSVYPGNAMQSDPSEMKKAPSNQNIPPLNSTANVTAEANEPEQLSSHSAAPVASAPVYHFNPNEGTPVTETGTADWIVNDDDSTNLFVLHRSAPIGTIMQITNLSNHKVVTAKVVGKLPGTSMNEPVLILVSDGVAHALGVSVEKFDVEINYSLAKQ